MRSRTWIRGSVARSPGSTTLMWLHTHASCATHIHARAHTHTHTPCVAYTHHSLNTHPTWCRLFLSVEPFRGTSAHLEHRQRAQLAGEDKVHEAPQLAQPVLDGAAADHQAVGRRQLLGHQGDLQCTYARVVGQFSSAHSMTLNVITHPYTHDIPLRQGCVSCAPHPAPRSPTRPAE